ncbi:hypothetical protein QCM77_44715 [Bradyrhizobium sp. SSUT18]|uniref:hypothetical protein n=1 Tax=unclassified Bradyrhizobium TaxID=2631580 RepID=UPI0024476794|nr:MULTISPECIES: hypothetical protein [unclassified Bradyrhizobium]MDH2357239.1 hypothetical protein [Bradyrhizobium sp. SSUT112]MDH2406884.1 hypothetical protein [Bradyrhizobium sp. SSUT18]
MIDVSEGPNCGSHLAPAFTQLRADTSSHVAFRRCQPAKPRQIKSKNALTFAVSDKAVSAGRDLMTLATENFQKRS